jgi:hypothetical protein
MELAYMIANTWMDKENMVHKHSEVLFGHKEE